MQQHDNAQPLTTNQRIWQSLQLPLVQYLLLYLVVMCVYVPTFWYTYVWDDWGMIALNTSLREWSNIPSYFTDPNTFSHDPLNKHVDAWRPLRNVYYLVTYKIHGFHPAGWHFQHVLLHSLLSAMILALFHRLYRYAMNAKEDILLPVPLQFATWFAVLAWAVHPVNTEVTAWLKSADDIIALLFAIASLMVLFPRNHHVTYARAIVASALFAISFLAKESIAPIPLIYIGLHLTLAPDRRQAIRLKPFWLASTLLFVALFIYLVLRKLILGQLEQVPYLAGNFSLMMATMTTAVVRYFQLTFWPFWPTVQIGDYIGWRLAASWSEPRVISSTCIILVVAILVILTMRRSRVFAAGWIFAALAFTPVANLIPMMQVMAERFLYFPLIGIALAVAACIYWLLRKNLHFLWLPVFLIIALTVTTHKRLPVWISEQNFQEDTMRALPGNWRAAYNLALEHYQDGETTQALTRALDSVRMLNNEPSAVLIAAILIKQNNPTSATAYLQKIKRAFPESATPYMLEGSMAQADGQTTKARASYGEAVKLEPNNAVYNYYLAQMANDMGETTTAIQAARRALELDPALTTATALLNHLRHLNE